MDGVLDNVAHLEQELGESKKMYGAWSEKEIITKKNVLKNLMTNAEAHLIICFRAKTEYVIEMNARGKNVPKAIGLKEDMQADVRYEFDSVLSIDKETHEITIVKDRIGYAEYRMTADKPEAPITIEDGKQLAKIVSEGLSLDELASRKTQKLIAFILDEKAHKSSKVKYFEEAKKIEFTEDYLKSLNYDMLVKITNYIK
jgi:hypothetical protein